MQFLRCPLWQQPQSNFALPDSRWGEKLLQLLRESQSALDVVETPVAVQRSRFLTTAQNKPFAPKGDLDNTPFGSRQRATSHIALQLMACGQRETVIGLS